MMGEKFQTCIVHSAYLVCEQCVQECIAALEADLAAARAERDALTEMLANTSSPERPPFTSWWEWAIKYKRDAKQVARERDEARAEVEALRAVKDGAYLERNQCVSALSKLFPAGIKRTAIEGWSDDWHGCVYIDLPTGQVSWHYHDSQAYLFAHLPPYPGQWDGHSTDEKYGRLAAIDAARKDGNG